ncbi:MAG: hypothetical protein AAF330_01420 [Pseudomonadota bacterium]
MKPETIEACRRIKAPEGRAIMDRLRIESDHGLPAAEAKMWHAHPV